MPAILEAVYPTRENLPEISLQFEQSSPEHILAWAVNIYGAKLAFATAFGREGCVLLDMLANTVPNGKQVYVFNLDTGYQFDETIKMAETIFQRYGILVDFVRSEESRMAMEARFGGVIYRTMPDTCCDLRKLQPLRRALSNKAAWISAIRRDQTPDRAKASIVEWDEKFGLVKVNPLANWSAQEVLDYIEKHDVPTNPLHELGYSSIGCYPCTRPIAAGEDERAGRWSSLPKLECGIHTRR